MRPRSLARLLAVPVVAAGIAVGVVGAPAAHAQTLNIDTSGTVALTVPFSFVEQLAEAGIVEFPVPLSELSVDTTNQTVTVTFNVTGGDGDLSVFQGAVDLSGSIVIGSITGHVVDLGNLQFDVHNGQIDGTPVGTSTPVVLLDLTNNVFAVETNTPAAGTSTDLFNSANVVVDSAGASYLNSALHTSAFQAGQAVGSLTSDWTVTYPS